MSQQTASANSSPSLLVSLILGVAATGFVATGASAAKFERVIDVPAALRVPEGHVKVFEAIVADGVQSYRCTSERKYALLGPTTMLRGRKGQYAVHYFGPTWQYQDGSTVAAKAIAKEPRANAIDQLLLQVSQHSGPDGLLSDVDFIQRLATVGGVAPQQCDPSRNAVVSVAYSAVYQFWAPKK